MATADSTVTYKDIPGFPGYRVGDDGTVWSCWRLKGLGHGRGTRSVMSHMHWRPIKQKRGRNGYLEVALRRNKKYAYLLVHRLVLETFVGPCPVGQECRHLDGNPANNVVSNLLWGTAAENAADRVTHGTAIVGESSNLAKLTSGIIRAIRTKYATGSVTQTDLASEHGITQANVSEIVGRRTWRHVE